MQSNVMADCNECFPVGWTVTLWMAGDSRPKGERIRNSPAISVLGLILTDTLVILYLFVGRCHNCTHDRYVSTLMHNVSSHITVLYNNSQCLFVEALLCAQIS